MLGREVGIIERVVLTTKKLIANDWSHCSFFSFFLNQIKKFLIFKKIDFFSELIFFLSNTNYLRKESNDLFGRAGHGRFGLEHREAEEVESWRLAQLVGLTHRWIQRTTIWRVIDIKRWFNIF